MSCNAARATVSAGGRLLRTKLERTIAFQLMVFGGWEHVETPHFDANGRLLRVDHAFEPYDPEGVLDEQGFAIVTSLSSLHAARYTASTLDTEGGFEALRLEPEPWRSSGCRAC